MDIVGIAEILATLPHHFGIGGADEKPEHHPAMNVVATCIRIRYQCLEGAFVLFQAWNIASGSPCSG